MVKYKIIKSESQYEAYCNELLEKVKDPLTRESDEVELLTLLIEKWDTENIKFNYPDPIETIKVLMKEHKLNSTDLCKILKLSKGTISKMLNYKKGLSKETIRNLSEHFKLSQEIFNKPYPLHQEITNTNNRKSFADTKKTLTKIKHPV